MSNMVPIAVLADSDSVLFYGSAGRSRAGARFYVTNRSLHALDRETRTGHEAHH